MKKTLIVITIMALLILISVLTGCKTNVNIDANEAKNEVECRNVKGDYIWLAGKCCLDSNNNYNCDEDEGSRSCSNDCSQPGCMEDNQFKAYDCVVGKDGCLHRQVLGIQVGKCNVECLDDNGCRINQKCVNYKCEDKICGDGQCDDTENCNCIDCAVSKDQICCSGTTYLGNCCSEEDCNDEETCDNNLCTSIIECGDGICQSEAGENCDNCLLDCQILEGQICCSEVIKDGNCCSYEDCEEDQICTENICVTTEQINQTE